MIVQLGPYNHLRKVVQTYLENRPGEDVNRSVNQLVQLTSAPAIVIAWFMREQQPNETINKTINSLISFYGYEKIEDNNG